MNLFTKIQRSTKKRPAKKTKFQSDETFSEFNTWYSEFCDRHGHALPRMISLEAWFDLVNLSHEEIREAIGGIRSYNVFDIESGLSPASMDKCRPIIDRLNRILPNYKYYYGFDDGIFLNQYIQYGGREIKLTKHIMNYAHAMGVGYNEKDLNKVFADLGEQWAQAKPVKDTVHMYVSTSCRAFVLLGHYGPDNHSCFNNRGCNRTHKFNLGQSDNTFVALFRRKPCRVPDPINSDATLARMWGFYSKKQKTVNFCNYYERLRAQDRFTLRALREACQMQAAKILGIPSGDVKLSERVIRITNNKAFHNCSGLVNWTFNDPNVYDGSIQGIKVNGDY